MFTSLDAVELKRAIRSRQRVPDFLGSCWEAFQQWRKRDRLRTELYALNDRELMDIGITRSEIEYFASNRSIDQRGIRPAE
jgi:uncharacterized protein YjiS (DUF1127 family)